MNPLGVNETSSVFRESRFRTCGLEQRKAFYLLLWAPLPTPICHTLFLPYPTHQSRHHLGPPLPWEEPFPLIDQTSLATSSGTFLPLPLPHCVHQVNSQPFQNHPPPVQLDDDQHWSCAWEQMARRTPLHGYPVPLERERPNIWKNLPHVFSNFSFILLETFWRWISTC